jgi:2-C-methyl-D-erythritol 4-phosphate cytidylyltransferase
VNHARIAGVVVALAPDDRSWATVQVAGSPRIHCVTGGVERPASVLAGLDHLSKLAAADDWVLVHDAARPCLTRALLDALINSLEHDEVGGLLAVPAQDTIKQAQDGRVSATLDRSLLWQAQTPQMFRLGMLHAALQSAVAAGRSVTDEAQAMEFAGHQPRLVPGSPENLKITRQEELAFAEFILQRRQGVRHA